jgi:hypothetical protein
VNIKLWVLGCLLFGLGTLAPAAMAASQQPKNTPSQSQPRVYVADSESWEIIGGWGMSGNRNANGSGSVSGGYTAGGARPQTAEIIKTFNQRCSNVTITNNVQKADFAVILDHEGGKGLVHRRNKIAVFNRDGDVIFSDSTRELGNSVKDACQAILTAPPRPRETSATSALPASQSGARVENLSQTNSDALIDITSVPSGADVELDGSFMGNTPSAIGLSQGDHAITVKKKGYKTWQRKIKVSSGKVNVFAELEADDKQNSVEGAATTTLDSEESKQKADASALEHPVLPVALSTGTARTVTSEGLGSVSFTSDPNGAEVYIDDAFVGKSPITLNLKIGHHYVRMFARDYKNWSEQFTIVTGAELRLTAVLQKLN